MEREGAGRCFVVAEVKASGLGGHSVVDFW